MNKKRKITAAVLVGAGIALLIASVFFPYWNMILVAPQYPSGLKLSVFVNKLEGDVSELDIINHYIGMRKMDEGAKVERVLGVYIVAAASTLSALSILAGKKIMSLLALPALLFPVAFAVELFRWLYKFGHELSPIAPIRIEPFTPTFLGEGKIAQFTTAASFGPGFYLTVGAVALIGSALIIRNLTCGRCPQKEKCSVLCPGFFRAY